MFKESIYFTVAMYTPSTAQIHERRLTLLLSEQLPRLPSTESEYHQLYLILVTDITFIIRLSRLYPTNFFMTNMLSDRLTVSIYRHPWTRRSKTRHECVASL